MTITPTIIETFCIVGTIVRSIVTSEIAWLWDDNNTMLWDDGSAILLG